MSRPAPSLGQSLKGRKTTVRLCLVGQSVWKAGALSGCGETGYAGQLETDGDGRKYVRLGAAENP